MAERKDIITEEEFTRQMRSTSVEPQDDSPGDSESDAGTEFLMGMAYEPGDLGDDEQEDSEVEQMQTVKKAKEGSRVLEDLPESAKVISANQPSPWMDSEASSDTN